MAKLYANENFPLPVVVELRRMGHDVLTMRDSGHANQSVPDAEVLNFAASQGRAILSLNRKHFIRMHQQSTQHAGLLVCTFDLDFAALAARIHNAVEASDPLSGRLIRINRVAPAGA